MDLSEGRMYALIQHYLWRRIEIRFEIIEKQKRKKKKKNRLDNDTRMN